MRSTGINAGSLDIYIQINKYGSRELIPSSTRQKRGGGTRHVLWTENDRRGHLVLSPCPLNRAEATRFSRGTTHQPSFLINPEEDEGSHSHFQIRVVVPVRRASQPFPVVALCARRRNFRTGKSTYVCYKIVFD
jgi:hypothetical protein